MTDCRSPLISRRDDPTTLPALCAFFREAIEELKKLQEDDQGQTDANHPNSTLPCLERLALNTVACESHIIRWLAEARSKLSPLSAYSHRLAAQHPILRNLDCTSEAITADTTPATTPAVTPPRQAVRQSPQSTAEVNPGSLPRHRLPVPSLTSCCSAEVAACLAEWSQWDPEAAAGAAAEAVPATMQRSDTFPPPVHPSVQIQNTVDDLLLRQLKHDGIPLTPAMMDELGANKASSANASIPDNLHRSLTTPIYPLMAELRHGIFEEPSPPSVVPQDQNVAAYDDEAWATQRLPMLVAASFPQLDAWLRLIIRDTEVPMPSSADDSTTLAPPLCGGPHTDAAPDLSGHETEEYLRAPTSVLNEVASAMSAGHERSSTPEDPTTPGTSIEDEEDEDRRMGGLSGINLTPQSSPIIGVAPPLRASASHRLQRWTDRLQERARSLLADVTLLTSLMELGQILARSSASTKNETAQLDLSRCVKLIAALQADEVVSDHYARFRHRHTFSKPTGETIEEDAPLLLSFEQLLGVMCYSPVGTSTSAPYAGDAADMDPHRAHERYLRCVTPFLPLRGPRPSWISTSALSPASSSQTLPDRLCPLVWREAVFRNLAATVAHIAHLSAVVDGLRGCGEDDSRPEKSLGQWAADVASRVATSPGHPDSPAEEVTDYLESCLSVLSRTMLSALNRLEDSHLLRASQQSSSLHLRQGITVEIPSVFSILQSYQKMEQRGAWSLSRPPRWAERCHPLPRERGTWDPHIDPVEAGWHPFCGTMCYCPVSRARCVDSLVGGMLHLLRAGASERQQFLDPPECEYLPKEENFEYSPALLTCGHVISYNSMRNLLPSQTQSTYNRRSPLRAVACPYCGKTTALVASLPLSYLS